MIGSKTSYKCETAFKGLYENFQTWIDGSVTILTGVVTTIVNIRRIKPYNNSIEEVKYFICRKV